MTVNQQPLRRRYLQAFMGLMGGVGIVPNALSVDTTPRVYDHPSTQRVLNLPVDHGPHPDFRTEWWYFTGWLKPVTGSQTATTRNAEPIGLQITFFRSAPNVDGISHSNPQRFAPAQLLFAHVAVADPKRGQLWHEQISVRAGLSDSDLHFDASASEPVLIRIKQWRLSMNRDGMWRASIRGKNFNITLDFFPTQSPWLQGQNGFSQKGPKPEQYSHYITLPHLRTTGNIAIDDKRYVIGSGQTWMDHEWSTTVLDPTAKGWDWVGLHGLDGSSLMAFRIRPGVWSHASLRDAQGRVRHFKKVQFEPMEQWTSTRTQATYPVRMKLTLDELTLELVPLMNDQELDARASTGTVYWEGAVSVFEAGQNRTGTLWGQGYLELTGYLNPMKL